MTSHSLVNSSAWNVGLALAPGGFDVKVRAVAFGKDYPAHTKHALGHVSALESDQAVLRGPAAAVCRGHDFDTPVRAHWSAWQPADNSSLIARAALARTYRDVLTSPAARHADLWPADVSA